MTYASESDRPAFQSNEEQWFSEAPARRPSQRPTRPAPAPTTPPPSLDDATADGWFFDV